MNKQDVINYCMNTPENTNPAVLNSLIDQLPSGEDTFYVDITWSLSEPSAISYNKTASEINEAFENNKTVYFKLQQQGGLNIFIGKLVQGSPNKFCNMLIDCSDDVYILSVYVKSDEIDEEINSYEITR